MFLRCAKYLGLERIMTHTLSEESFETIVLGSWKKLKTIKILEVKKRTKTSYSWIKNLKLLKIILVVFSDLEVKKLSKTCYDTQLDTI